MTPDPNGYDIATTDDRYATVGLYRYLEPDGGEPLGLDLLPLATDADAAALLGEGWLHDVRRKACSSSTRAGSWCECQPARRRRPPCAAWTRYRSSGVALAS